MNVISPTDLGALVYYEATNIRGVAFTADESLAQYDHLRIPVDIAAQFIDGTLDHRDWIVWRNAAGVALYNSASDIDVSVDLIASQFSILPPTARSPLTLAVKLYRAAQRMVLQINSTAGLRCTETASLPFVFTVRHDPATVLHIVEVSVSELLQEQLLDLVLPIDPMIPLDVHTRCLFETYVEYPSTDADILLSLPRGHFIDLMRMQPGRIDRGLHGVLRRADGVLRVSLVGQAIESYHRSTPVLRLLISQPGDPTLLWHTAEVSVAQLREGCEVHLPKNLATKAFDVWAPLMYRRATLEIV